MSWQSLIQPGPVWSGVSMYADARISELTAICTSAETTPEAWREALAGIEELRRLKALPDQLSATAQVRENSARRRAEY